MAGDAWSGRPIAAARVGSSESIIFPMIFLQLVPDDVRATVISMFRMPVNLLVCAVMWNVGLFSIGSIFALCMGMVALAAFLISGLPQPGAKGKAA